MTKNLRLPRRVNIANAARILGNNRGTLYQWIKQKKLKAVTVKRRSGAEEIMIPSAEIRRILKEQGIKPHTKPLTLTEHRALLAKLSHEIVNDTISGREKIKRIRHLLAGYISTTQSKKHDA